MRRRQLGERPGEYKGHDYMTGRGEIGAAPEDVADEMQELVPLWEFPKRQTEKTWEKHIVHVERREG